MPSKQTNDENGPLNSGDKNEKAPAFIVALQRTWYSSEIYKFLYFFGLQLLRAMRRRRRYISRHWRKAAGQMEGHWRHFLLSMRISMRSEWRELTSPFREVKIRYKQLLEDLNYEKRYGSNLSVMKQRGVIAAFLLRRCWTVLRCVFNYVAPIAACFFLYITIQNFNGLTFGLRLVYDGEAMGYIENEAVYNQAEAAMLERLRTEEFLGPVDIVPRLELTLTQDAEMLTVDELTDMLIQFSGNELREADGLYLEIMRNGRSQMVLVGAVEEGQELLHFLDGMLEKYRTTDMAPDTQIQFIKKMQLKHGLYPTSTIRSLGEMRAELSGEEKGEQYYTVVEGDTPMRIAAKNGISFEELKALNPDVDVSLFPGDQLLISKSVPVLSVKVTTTVKYEEEIDFKIEQETVPSQNVGWTNLKQQGEKGLIEITAKVEIIDGIESEPVPISRTVVREPVSQILEVGGNKPLQVIPQTSSQKVPSGAFAWPTSGGRIGPGYMGYYGHTGSDISFSGCYGTPVYASAAGTVAVVNYSSYGYGYHIYIDHGGGISTLYAHCSELYVTPGQYVEQGQAIAAIGRTGNATGPHLHFEVRINNTPVNAAPYLYG